jgi:basic membrane lipoprotein Med (substrate-binding protein (PBP1-ABC) superfamily)
MSILLGACQQATPTTVAEPETVIETVIVESTKIVEVEKTVEVEVPVEVLVTPTPGPNPEAVIPNVEGLVYTTNEAAMLVGYVSAGMSKSGVMGTFGGINIGAGVTDFMDGFVAGANYYNKENSKSVTVLGWNAVTKEGSFTGDFESLDNAKALTVPMLQEGADVILPVGGPIGGGAYAALQESAAEDYGIGVDVDWVVSAPQYRDVLLTSILKKIDVSLRGEALAGSPRLELSARPPTAAWISACSTTSSAVPALE